MTRRFQRGSTWQSDGIAYEVRSGRKWDGDLVLWVATPRLMPAPMSLGFICADFFQDNEERGFNARHHVGGAMYGQALRVAMEVGWAEARQILEDQKEGRAGRDSFGLRDWGGAVPWLICDACGKGRAELARNLGFWVAKCNLTEGCPGTLNKEGTLPPIGSKR